MNFSLAKVLQRVSCCWGLEEVVVEGSSSSGLQLSPRFGCCCCSNLGERRQEIRERKKFVNFIIISVVEPNFLLESEPVKMSWLRAVAV